MIRSLTVLASIALLNLAQAQRPEGGRGGPGFGGPPPLEILMKKVPLLSALDSDANGEISTVEMENAPEAIWKLDEDDSNSLAGAELAPRRGRGGGGDTNATLLMPKEVPFEDGVATISDHGTFQKLSYKGAEVMVDQHLSGTEFVKFQIENGTTDKPRLYFINTVTHRGHPMFMRKIGIQQNGRSNPDQMRGVLSYRPRAKDIHGKAGVYTFEFEPNDNYAFKHIKRAHDLLVEKMPPLKGKLGFTPLWGGMDIYEKEIALYDGAKFPVYFEEELADNLGFLPLNLTESYGLLRLMDRDERPSPRDIVIYKTLPNELPRVAGIITEVRQTPLSHVNLRAVQDNVPNAFVTEASDDPAIAPLIGKYVHYKVSGEGYELRVASQDEVTKHFAELRPREPQTPVRDLTITRIRPLTEVQFQESKAFGVKAANIATLGTFGFSEGTVPTGHAIPFHFYHAFMTHNGFYDQAKEFIENPRFQGNREAQVKTLKAFRRTIKDGDLPDWMMTELTALHKAYPPGQSLRCRSSTNNEDLEGFSGAGLYESFTHKRDEGHLSKSIKQVFASLWNYRAFDEREFYRIDHFTAAMGVLVHPNYKEELANGVAVTDDILYQTEGTYYVNVQVGEDLVTNPEGGAVPEENLLDWTNADNDKSMLKSNLTDKDSILSAGQTEQLRKGLSTIHNKFAKLYGKDLDADDFAMEIEFKITKQGKLTIKQARPWVY